MTTRIKIENGQIVARIQKQQIKAPSGRTDYTGPYISIPKVKKPKTRMEKHRERLAALLRRAEK